MTQARCPLILIVEDDRAILDSLVELLEEEGFRASQARDGQEALDLLRRSIELPDLILLDLMMPRKDGVAFREEQQRDPRLAQIPVLLMSADGHLESKRLQLGLRHIKKPLDVDRFLETVRKFV